jgi:hypothetical protein
MFRRQFARRVGLAAAVLVLHHHAPAKAGNLARDPWISVSVFELENPYDSVQVRGAAELVEDTGRCTRLSWATKTDCLVR